MVHREFLEAGSSDSHRIKSPLFELWENLSPLLSDLQLSLESQAQFQDSPDISS